MIQKSLKKVLLIGLLAISGTFTINAQSNQRQRPNERPSVEEIFKELDTNEDGKLSKKEIKGPLKNDFSKIDTNEDGYISKEELEKAPKPNKRDRN